jgi:SSS family solute:Na+ symporter
MNVDVTSGIVTAASVDPTFLKDGNFVNDNAAPWLIGKYVPMGLKGLVLAALAAAIVSSLASMVNSTSTIFTMDIYQPLINKDASQTRLVNVGRITGGVALIMAIFIAPLLGNLGQVFQYIQEYTGIVSPGILAVFIMGLFYRKATNSAAIWGVIMSIPIAMFFKIGAKGWVDSAIFPNLPFLHQMGLTALLTMLIIAVISNLQKGKEDDEKAIDLHSGIFKTSSTFNISAILICLIVAFLYAYFW